MASSLAFIYLTVVLLVLVLSFKHFREYRSKDQLPLPPGPPADPIIGHARFIPPQYSWKTFSEWGKNWGGLIYVHVLGQPMVIISDISIARELLDKRGAIYSDRPRLVLFCEMMGWDKILAFLPYGDKFRKHRRMMQQHFNSQAVVGFRPLQRVELYTLLDNLLKSPEKFAQHFHRATAATMTMATYGHRVVSDDDAYVKLVEKTNAMTVQSGTPGGTPVDFFPALRHIPAWFPGAGFKRHAVKTYELVQEMLTMPYELVKRNRASGIAFPSFISYLLDEYEQTGSNDPDHEEDIKAVGGVVYGAGVETTESTLLTFMLAMVLHPEVAKRAQAEIDNIIGRERLPTLEDRDSLPYIDCIVKETLRWNPPTPLGIPHRVMESDTYNGMHIPGGAMIIPNLWQIMRDERYYPEPDHYNPDRFLHKAYGGISEDDYNPLNVAFGFGRRVCPGRFFAETGLWLTMASVLAAFDIKAPIDEQGREFIPPATFTSGTASQPEKFRCRIVPRSEKYIHLIKQEEIFE